MDSINPIKTPVIHRTSKRNPKIGVKMQKITNSKAILSRKNNTRKITNT